MAGHTQVTSPIYVSTVPIVSTRLWEKEKDFCQGPGSNLEGEDRNDSAMMLLHLCTIILLILSFSTLLCCHHCCYQGTNSEKDAHFYNKQKKLLKTMKFPSNIGIDAI